MVKSFVSMLVVSLIIFFSALGETYFIKKQFSDFNGVLEVLYSKIDDETAVQEDVYAVQDNWINRKRFLHVFIPHNEIKEIDLWLAESATLVRDKEWNDAISKLEVLIELCEQIPKTFIVSFDNVL